MLPRLLMWLVRRMFLPCGLLAILMFWSIPVLPASADTMAFVRLVHASPDAGTVDVFMDGTKLLSNFQFGTITGYAPVVAGTHSLQIAVIGTGPSASVLAQSISVDANTSYTVAALGTKATGFSLQVFSDNNLVSGNDAKVRVYHLSPGTGSVNVAASGTTLVSDLSYEQASNYLTVPAGSYTFNVTATQNNTTMPVAAQLKPWTVTSIFAVSSSSNGNLKLQLVDAQVPGVPGMPGTGSDPTALPSTDNSFFFFPWLVAGAFVVLLLGVGLCAMNVDKAGRRN